VSNDVRTKPELFASWEVIFRPYPNMVKQPGEFDTVLNLVCEAMGDDLSKRCVPTYYGDVGVTAHFDREIIVSVSPEDLTMKTSIEMVHAKVMEALAGLGLEGWSFAQEIITSARPMELDEDDDE
jgi:hypothetical protein